MREIPVELGRNVHKSRLERAVIHAAQKLNLKVASRRDETKEVYFLNPARMKKVYDKTVMHIVCPNKQGSVSIPEGASWFADIEFSAPPADNRTNSMLLYLQDKSSASGFSTFESYEKLVLQYLDALYRNIDSA